MPADAHRGDFSRLDQPVDRTQIDLQVVQNLRGREKSFFDHLGALYQTRACQASPAVKRRLAGPPGRSAATGSSMVNRAPPSGDVARENRAAVLLDDPVGDGESEPGALVDFLGREERVENPRQDVAIDAGAGVADARDDRVAGRRPGSVVMSIVPGRPVGDDGMFGVDQHVEERLMEQQRIRDHERRILGVAADHLDAGARERGAAAREGALDTRSTVSRRRTMRPRTREHQQVADDLRRAVRLAAARAAARCAPVPPSPTAAAARRSPSTPCSGLLISCATPATNWPSDASFSDWASRVRRASRSASSCDLPGHVARHDHAADQVVIVVDQRRHRDHDRLAERASLECAGTGATRREASGASSSRWASSASTTHAASVSPTTRGERRTRGGPRAGVPGNSPRASLVWTTRRPLSVTISRSASELNESLSSRCWRTTSSTSRRFSMTTDSWRATSCASSSAWSAVELGGRRPR